MDAHHDHCNLIRWRTNSLYLRMGPWFCSKSEKAHSVEDPAHSDNLTQRKPVSALISLGEKDYVPSLHSWYIRCSSPFIRKELCNCHNISISKLPDPILTCDKNSPSSECPTSCNIVSPKSHPFPKHVLLGESFTVWPLALFLTWIKKKKAK